MNKIFSFILCLLGGMMWRWIDVFGQFAIVGTYKQKKAPTSRRGSFLTFECFSSLCFM